MTKNWISLALLCWGSITTLLLFMKRDCSICTESSNTVSTNSDTGGKFQLDHPAVEVLDTSKNITMKVVQSPEVDQAQRHAVEEHLVGYISKIFNQKSAYEKEGFTMIMLTYKRVKVLPKLLLHYCKARSLHKILVIWNDVESQVPQDILALAKQCQVPLVFIQEKENKLTNRFKPRPEIETECEPCNIPYSRKFSWSSIFADGQSLPFHRFNFNIHAHSCPLYNV